MHHNHFSFGCSLELLVSYRFKLTGLYRYCFQFPASVTGTLEHEHCGIIECPVQCTEQIIIFTEELFPLMCGLVACKDNGIRPILGITAVNDIEEHLSVVSVKYAAANLIYDEAGRFDQAIDNGSLPAAPAGFSKLLVQFSRLKEICFHSLLAAFIPESHRQMSLSNTLRTYEGQVLMRINRRQ